MTGAEQETQRLIAEVTASMRVLSEAVHQLSERQETEIKRTQRVVKWTIAGLVVDLLLSLIGGMLYIQVRHNSDQLSAINARTSTQALCPLYELFLRSYNPQSPIAKQDPDEYERDFAVIEQGARVLGCVHVVRGR